MPGDWLARLIEDWRAFDPLTLQARLDRFSHLRAEVDGISVHLVHAPGTGPDPLPLVLTHGWPSSFLEYLTLLPLLTDPAAHGGDPADAFTVVLPSLPGFGFSGPPPPGGLLHQQVAELWHTIMARRAGLPALRRARRVTSAPASPPGWPAPTPRRSRRSTSPRRGWPRRPSPGPQR